MRKKEILILVAILFLFFGLQYKNFQKNTQSFRFGDESEHVTPAWMMANYNSKLYTDITTNHQPLPILTSAVFFKITKYQNPFMLIERLRQYMFLISFLGALVLVLKFRLVGLISAILIETVKFYLLGYHVLAESLVLYPVMFLTATVAVRLFKNKQPKFSDICQNLEVVLFGLSTFWVAFSLLPAWPFLIVVNLIYLYLLKKEKRFLLIFSIIIPSMLLFMLISPHGWYRYTILDNIQYFIPQDTQTKSWSTYLLILVYPFQSILNPNGPIGKYLFILVTLLITATVFTLANKKNGARFVFKFTILYLLLVLLNLRITRIDIGFYTAFHILPMLGALTIASVMFYKNSIRILEKAPLNKLAVPLIEIAFLLAALFFNTTWWREKVDKTNEHFIQYGDIQSLGSALNIIKLDNDKLLVGQLEGLLNIFADIPVAGRQNAYLGWSFQSNESKTYFIKMMDSSPPTFIYFPPGGPYFNLLASHLQNDYTQIQRGNGNPTNAYILTSQINKRSKQQWRDYENLYYKIPETTKTHQ